MIGNRSIGLPFAYRCLVTSVYCGQAEMTVNAVSAFYRCERLDMLAEEIIGVPILLEELRSFILIRLTEQSPSLKMQLVPTKNISPNRQDFPCLEIKPVLKASSMGSTCRAGSSSQPTSSSNSYIPTSYQQRVWGMMMSIGPLRGDVP